MKSLFRGYFKPSEEELQAIWRDNAVVLDTNVLLHEVWAFRPSDDSQERVRYLLERNEKGESTEDETTEPERFGELEHLMQLVKARAIVCLEDSDSENR